MILRVFEEDSMDESEDIIGADVAKTQRKIRRSKLGSKRPRRRSPDSGSELEESIYPGGRDR
jgi:hypothetical protein